MFSLNSYQKKPTDPSPQTYEAAELLFNHCKSLKTEVTSTNSTEEYVQTIIKTCSACHYFISTVTGAATEIICTKNGVNFKLC